MLDDANPVGRYRVEDASPTDGVVAGTAGVVAGTTTGVVAGVVAPGTDVRAVGRYRVEDARPTDLEGETGREFTCEAPAAADRGEHHQAAGATTLNVIAATGSDARGECSMPK